MRLKYEENNANSFSERNNNMHAGNAGNGILYILFIVRLKLHGG